MNYEQDGKVSEWNPAQFKMMRLHGLTDLVNQVNGNLLAFNQEYGVWNFEVKFSQCQALQLEVFSKLTKDEKKKVEQMRKAIEDFIKKYPIYEKNKSKSYPYSQKVKVNQDHWEILKSWLYDYDALVRDLLDKHGLDTKYEEEEEDEEY